MVDITFESLEKISRHKYDISLKIKFKFYVGEKMSDLYNIEDKGDYLVYTFDGIAIKIKSIENEETDRG